MESKDNFTGSASDNYVKVEINEGQWWQEDAVTESKSNITFSDDHKIDIKMEIKEEVGCLKISPEIKFEPENPFVSDTDLENKAKDDDSWIVGLDEDFQSRISSRLHTESIYKFSDEATSFFPNINSKKCSYSDSDTISEYQLLNSSQPQEFELPTGAKTYTSLENCKVLHKCNICGESFELLSDLRQHSIKHEDKKLFKTEMDEKEYAQESNLKHEGKRLHLCEICNKNFTRLSHLKCHILIHEGKRLHTCTICNKSFSQSSHLKRHTLIHEGKRPHKCETCKRAFIHKSALKQHELTHEGRRPHTCEICKKRYTHMTTLKRHKLNHEGKRPYTCEICMKSFIQSSSLKEHKLIHEGKRPHICEICNKNFSNNSNLKRHKSIHEGKNT